MDHPHAYGDKSKKSGRAEGFTGSSPRVWGQVDININAQKTPRIIPTRMGTRLASLCDTMLSGDHPHAYGDKSWSFAPADSVAGSSPRVWGQVDGKSKATFEKRIIPTRMGTRDLECKQAILKWDHPHAYGDKEVSDIADEMSDGSSPRVWGQELICPHCKSSDRIIPTRMGTRYI